MHGTNNYVCNCCINHFKVTIKFYHINTWYSACTYIYATVADVFTYYIKEHVRHRTCEKNLRIRHIITIFPTGYIKTSFQQHHTYVPVTTSLGL